MKVLIVDDSEPMRRMIKTFVADLVQDVIERVMAPRPLPRTANINPTWS